VSESAGQGIDTVQSGIDYSLTANVENLTLTGDSALTGIGKCHRRQQRRGDEAIDGDRRLTRVFFDWSMTVQRDPFFCPLPRSI
jgi:hypothetical protein